MPRTYLDGGEAIKDQEDIEDEYLGDLEEEFDVVLGCDIGINLSGANKLDGCTIHRDSDDDSILQIRDHKGKLVGKIAVYYED
jgi:hypothetical protein